MSGFYRFPAMAKLREWSNHQQVRKLSDEVNEVVYELNHMAYMHDVSCERDDAEAFSCYLEHRDYYGMGLMDVIHAAETALHMEFDDSEVEQLRDTVETKNRERGYYGE